MSLLDYLINENQREQPKRTRIFCHHGISWRGRTIWLYMERYIWLYMSLVMRKPVFWVWDQGRLKPACATTEAMWRLEISYIETRSIILYRQRTINVLIRLRRCACWSAPLLFAYGKNRFSHDIAHVERYIR